MQQAVLKNPRITHTFTVHVLVGAALLGVLASLTGCGGDNTPLPSSRTKPHNGTALFVRCPDQDFAAALTPAVQSWADRTGAKVTVLTEAMATTDDTDIGILPLSAFGAWADRSELARIPANFRSGESFQWTGLLPAYREQLIEWGGQAQAVPLAGDGMVIVYRHDRLTDPKFVEFFRAAHRRPPTAPPSWEEFAVLAGALTSFTGKPSLPTLTGEAAADLFFRIAACFNHSAMSDPKAVSGAILSFEFDAATARPRLTEPPFIAAAELLNQLAANGCFPPQTPSSDPVAAISTGDASLAVLSLAQLARLPRENGAVPARFGIAPLPGTMRFADPEKGMLGSKVVNYVPYLAHGWLGVVRTRCQHQEAAFELLAELGGPVRSLELVSTPGIGAGPSRVSHLERDRLSIWYGYGFDAERTKQLQDAMRSYVRPEVKTPAIGLRGPDQAALDSAAATALGKLVGKGAKPSEVVSELTAMWNEIDARTPLETRIRWRKMAAGAN